ncbi:putative RNA-directed DNA polymerase, partial [Tanacetum coccineum]
DKFEQRGKPRVFLGYPQRTKGYKIYDIEDGKIIVNKDVSFIKNVCPFKNITEGNCDNDDDPTKIQNETPHDILDTPKIAPKISNEDESVQAQQENGFDFGTINQQGGEDGVEETFGSNLDLGPEGHDEPTNIQNEPQRRSKRMKSQPTRFNDYVIKLPPSVDHSQLDSNQASSTVHPISHFVSYDKFSNSHKAFLMVINSNDKPSCFKQASQDEKLREAMQQEIKALKKNGT